MILSSPVVNGYGASENGLVLPSGGYSRYRSAQQTHHDTNTHERVSINSFVNALSVQRFILTYYIMVYTS